MKTVRNPFPTPIQQNAARMAVYDRKNVITIGKKNKNVKMIVHMFAISSKNITVFCLTQPIQ